MERIELGQLGPSPSTANKVSDLGKAFDFPGTPSIKKKKKVGRYVLIVAMAL